MRKLLRTPAAGNCHKKLLKLPGARVGYRYFLPKSSKAAASSSLPAEMELKCLESKKLQNLH